MGLASHVSLVEQSVLLYGDEEGQVFVEIFGRDAVRHVVLLEVEQAACAKGKNDNGVRMTGGITKMNVS